MNIMLSALQKNGFLRKIVYKLGDARLNDSFQKISVYIDRKDKILDIGAGSCNLVEIMRKRHFMITPLDVENLSFVKGIKPIIYDGRKIPFKDKTFDISLLLTVLHHISNPEQMLLEAKRVSKEIIVMEDIYLNIFHKLVTWFFDSLINIEFISHPHSNKNDEGWKKTFEDLGLKLIDAKYTRQYLIFQSVLYDLEVEEK